MNIPKPVPLYPTYIELKKVDFNDFRELKLFLDEGPEWRFHTWSWGQDFLSYTGRNKSEHTYTRFRSETERFLLWSFLVKQQPIDGLRKTDILEYADFCWKPPVSWIGLTNHEKFTYRNGEYINNPKWMPFRLKVPKGGSFENADKKKYKPSQQTISATFTALIAFYKYLMNEELAYGNPAQIAKKDCRYFIKDAQVKEIRRLSGDQWEAALEVSQELADNNPQYERSLFVIAALKTLFLRISELSERHDWSPVMSHFWQDTDENWWLKVYGKGRKIRDITVPDSFMSYLKRYRKYRNLSGLPYPGENEVIIEKLRGQGGMSSRHLSRLVQEIFDLTYIKVLKEHGEDKARKLKEASTHWLRHTGASMEIERGRALKDLSEDLGHASMATTDSIYVQSEDKKRAASGKERKVN